MMTGIRATHRILRISHVGDKMIAVKPGDVIANEYTYGTIVSVDGDSVEVLWGGKQKPFLYKEGWMFDLRMKAGRFKLVNSVER